MKLEKNTYVRTYHHGILKIKDKYAWDINGEIVYLCDNDREYFLEKEVTKASHNIIDLIEEGDYVNGYKIVDTNSKNENKIFYFDGEHHSDVLIYFEEQDIKSIVTKEAFESMEYRLGDK